MKLERPQAMIMLGLIVSALLNVFLVGFLVASHPRLRPPASAKTVRVPPRDNARAAMKLLFAGHHREFGDARREIREARMHVSDALLAEPFVASDLETALNELQERTQSAQGTLHNALLQRAPELTPEQRQNLARAHRLWSGPDGVHGRRGRKHRPHRVQDGPATERRLNNPGPGAEDAQDAAAP